MAGALGKREGPLCQALSLRWQATAGRTGRSSALVGQSASSD